jgi:hypothetical protein
VHRVGTRDALHLALVPVATGAAEEGVTADGEGSAVRVIREESLGLGQTWRHRLQTSTERMRHPSQDVMMPGDLWSEDGS